MTVAHAAPVLVVDDNDAIRQTLSLLLQEEGYRVATATDGQQALDRIAEERPAPVLTDLRMPVMDGWALQEQLDALGLDIPVVVLSARTGMRANAAMNRAAGYLVKPFAVEELLQTVARFVPPPVAVRRHDR